MGFLMIILFFGIILVWALLSDRIRQMEDRLNREAEKRMAAENAIAALERRWNAAPQLLTRSTDP